MSKRTIVKAEPGYAVLTAVVERDDKLRSIENVAEDAVVAWCVMEDGLVPTTFPITPSRRANIICADPGYLYPEPDGSNSNVYADCYALRDPQGTITFPDGVQVSSDVAALEEFERQYDRIEQRQIERKQALAAA
jgi:hypothetical protein